MADFAVDDGMEAMQREPAEIPNETKGLRACLRCGLVKTTEQYQEMGCENCEFLQDAQLTEYTSPHFDGTVSLMEPKESWLAKYYHLSDFVPGIYALNVHGSLSEEWVQYCEDNNRLYRAQLNQD